MPDEGSGEVLRGARSFTLGDEPLAGGVALRVLKIMHEQNITCIPIHDSFIVQEKYSVQIKNAMRSAFQSVFPNIKPRIK